MSKLFSAAAAMGTATRRREAGFTLIEVMIVCVVVAILAAVAMPSFLESIRKGRRSEAASSLMQLQQAQERWRANQPSYTSDLSDLGVAETTPSGRYTLSVIAATAESSSTALPLNAAYIAVAYGTEGSSQADDSACRRMAVRTVNGNLTYAGCGSCESFVFGDFRSTHICWAQ